MYKGEAFGLPTCFPNTLATVVDSHTTSTNKPPPAAPQAQDGEMMYLLVVSLAARPSIG